MTGTEKKTISFVIPVYNEAANIQLLHDELTSVLSDIAYHHEFIFVNDGSTDNSLARDLSLLLIAREHNTDLVRLRYRAQD
jgi:glycosyltransferase involved in cell wall biosynthesis